MIARVLDARIWVASVSHWIIALSVSMFLAPPLVSAGGQAFFWAFPVIHSWEPADIKVDGEDVLIRGTLRKRWSCEYQPPPRATDDSGVHLRVTSSNVVAAQSWDSGIHQFGVWRIHGGAGQKLRIWQHHECLGVFQAYSQLGIVDTRGK